MAELSKEKLHILKHSLTGGYNKWSRNYFASGPGCKDYDLIQELVLEGLMQPGKQMPVEMGSMEYFHVTDEGKRRVKFQ